MGLLQITTVEHLNNLFNEGGHPGYHEAADSSDYCDTTMPRRILSLEPFSLDFGKKVLGLGM